MVKKKRKMKKAPILFLALLIAVVGGYFALSSFLPKKIGEKQIMIGNFTGKTYQELKEFADSNNLILDVSYESSNSVEKDKIISQNIIDKEVDKKTTIKIVVSKGGLSNEDLERLKVNEDGKVPIMMYHGIIDMKSEDTKYTGGNVDKDGYNRTAEAFREDLEYYYQNGYRMIRLQDYINGVIDVEVGKSPIILTFDDGREDNFKVTGIDDKGNLQIDPNCAIGVLEEFKKKYPDFNVTATFFVNSGIFNQKEYNQKILDWLFANGYDVGNHTLTHPDFTKISLNESNKEVGGLYKILDEYAKDKYVNIIALPFGSPYKKSHANFDAIMNPTYEGKTWKTEAALRVGWDAEISPFDEDFDKTFLKRVRAYDNDGEEFDIKMVFTNLTKTRYISDGDKNTVTVPMKLKDNLKTDLKVITY